AIVDEFITGINLEKQIKKTFPEPGSGRGIEGYEYIRSLLFHFIDGGRFLEDIYDIKNDNGFCQLIRMFHMPTPDAVGDWLRRSGERGYVNHLNKSIDFLVQRYLKESKSNSLTLDVDSTLIESDKGDAEKSYKGIIGYHPMLGYLSDGCDDPICSYVKFRQGNASAQTDILEALKHTQSLLTDNKKIEYFRSDSAAYQADIINYCHLNEIKYTITADLDESVLESISTIRESDWKVLYDRKDGFQTGREYAETVHTMQKSNHSFRLIVIRKLVEQLPLFTGYDKYEYHCIINNISQEEMNGQQVIWHHNGRGNGERYIEDGKYGLNLRYVPCGQFEANSVYFTIGMLAYNLIKLMQLVVLPARWRKSAISTIKRRLFRLVAKVVNKSRVPRLKLNRSLEEIKEILLIREKIYELSLAR
ncbi:MAG: IS1380 family transposase, partial [Calditrichia bacterium]